MKLRSHKQENKFQQEGPEGINRAVAIEGKFLGREFDEYRLFGHSEKGQEVGAAMLGNDAFTEIYFETESGNEYKIQRTRDGKYVLMDARTNQGKGLEEIKETVLTEEDLENGVLRVGQSFNYGEGGRTTAISKITAVNGNRVYPPDYLEKYTEGATSDVRQEFVKRIVSKKEKE